MYLIINNKKLKIEELTTFKQKFKSLKFNFIQIDKAIKLTNKKLINTYFFCQKVDLVVTNKNEIIIYKEEKVPTEKMYFPKKNTKNIYFLPLNTAKYLNIGDVLLNYKK